MLCPICGNEISEEFVVDSCAKTVCCIDCLYDVEPEELIVLFGGEVREA